MIAILSPAKTMKAGDYPDIGKHDHPRHIARSQRLVNALKRLGPEAMQKLMGISPKLAGLNVARYAEWRWPPDEGQAHPSLFAFRGEVYNGLDADTLSIQELAYMQDHLRILSGLFGLLRPFDLILPYRLEMGTRLKTSPHPDLYGFWGDLLAKCLTEDLKSQGDDVLVNLASQEYFKAVDRPALKARVITPVFKERHGNTYRMVTLFAKHARGSMARFIAKHCLSDVRDIQGYSENGYHFHPGLSDSHTWVFTRG